MCEGESREGESVKVNGRGGVRERVCVRERESGSARVVSENERVRE